LGLSDLKKNGFGQPPERWVARSQVQKTSKLLDARWAQEIQTAHRILGSLGATFVSLVPQRPLLSVVFWQGLHPAEH
jgi:hypothetical protein